MVALDRDEAALTELTQAAGSRHERLAACVADTGTVAGNEAGVALAIERFGRLDALVANAGVYDGRRPLSQLDPAVLAEAYDQLFAVNVRGYLLGARVALAELERAGGAIVFTASISSHAAGFGGAVYVAAKHAVLGLTRQLALELGPAVRVNAVAPGYVATGLADAAVLSGEPAVSRSGGPPATVLPAPPAPGDLTGAYLLLVSDEGRSITGTSLVVDGGQLLLGPGPPPSADR